MGCSRSCARKIVIFISRGLQVLAILGLSNSLLSFSSRSSTISYLTLSSPSSNPSSTPSYLTSYPTFSSLLPT